MQFLGRDSLTQVLVGMHGCEGLSKNRMPTLLLGIAKGRRQETEGRSFLLVRGRFSRSICPKLYGDSYMITLSPYKKLGKLMPNYESKSKGNF
jgi:hypothetical protein